MEVEAKNTASRKGTGQNIMKKITSTVFGLSLALATVGLTFAQVTPAPADGNTKAPATAKHVKKHKKAVKDSTAAAPAAKAATPAPAPAK